QDGQILSLVARGDRAKLATRRLKEFPDALETIRLLAPVGRFDESLGALQRLVRNHPEQTAEAFRAVLEIMHRVPRDENRGYISRLREIVAEVRTRLPGLSAEPAARAERVLLEFDGYFSSPTGDRNAYAIKL